MSSDLESIREEVAMAHLRVHCHGIHLKCKQESQEHIQISQ